VIGDAVRPRLDPTAALIKHVLFPAWVKKNASTRLAYLEQFERSQFLSPDALRELQWSQFRGILQHAFDHCVFYRRKLTAAGIAPPDIRSLDDVARVPTTSKEEIQEFVQEMIADNVHTPLLKDMTGGSTGSPMIFYYDEDRLDSRAAATIRHNRWTGWDIGKKVAVLWGAPRDLAPPPSMKARVRDWILDRRLVFDASAIDEARLRAFYERMQRDRPEFVLAYANTLALFARYLQESGLRPPRPRAIICSAEVLTEENRVLIEATFGCQVFNRYGSREFAVIASQCGHHAGMHVNAENLLVETVAGELVVTDLKNLGMPLIRYRTRDTGEFIDGRCGCGRGLPLLDLRGGRVTDFLTGVAGQKVSGIVLATYAITNVPGVRQIQFVQRRRDRVTVRLARGPAWSEESATTLGSRLRTFLGREMTIELEYVEEIPLEASGKYRFSISSLAR
jgi:phenylacetate-CoA ligase